MRKGLSGLTWLVLILVVLVFTGVIKIPGFATTPTPTPTTKVCPDGTVIAISAACPTPAVTCPSTMQTTVKSAAKNPLAGSLTYTLTNLTFVEADSGEVKSTSDFTVAGSTKSYSTGVALTCGKHYKVYTNPGTNASAQKNFTSCSKDLGTLSSDTLYSDFDCAAASTVEFQAYFNNWSLALDWTEDGLTTNANPMIQGTILTSIIRYRVNTTVNTDSQFGSNELSTYICADFPLTAFAKTDINPDRTDWVEELSLPTFCSNNGYDKAWKIPAVKTTHGERDVKITMKASLGDPTTDIHLYSVDEAYFVGSDGKIKYGTVNDAGTDVGQPNRDIAINLS